MCGNFYSVKTIVNKIAVLTRKNIVYKLSIFNKIISIWAMSRFMKM